ncbi:nickel pincer cofactor biosynthesis protein LarB [Endomicrobium proavitum]|uniref:NCAIR-related protein n=1 Tax=Endomicrobium proavitum TaxID=1408281 RepID=A0A0G3WL22_9BACT|nr:nickel pincer cofactor biosynthesis protein LarB [Endomicrobium proavitum]AKL98557.1 NCAIR-related protein [Endomicrobium proavitum]
MDAKKILRHFKDGKISAEKTLTKLKVLPFNNLGYANIDYHRSLRQGACETIYAESKTCRQILGIVSDMNAKGLKNIIVTRVSPEKIKYLTAKKVNLKYFPQAKLAVVNFKEIKNKKGSVVIVSGGTSDIPVCEEAAVTAEVLGSRVTRLYDVGVAGVHRLLSNAETLANARVVIAVAGMEGALASVVGGVVGCPVIGVPTSVGYGASFGGVSALLSMLNSCANGVSVVNIDNGFGAGVIAHRINKTESAK